MGSVSKPELSDDDPPRTIGRYTVVGRLATGGMAEILLGKLAGPAGFERAVVIKRILPHLARQSTFVRMFVDEAKLAAQIRNANVVQVYELGQEANELFIVQEYLEGESTFGLMRRLVRTGRRLSPALAASVVADACAGLDAAHELCDAAGRSLGVVHRDVSPDNVFVTYDGAVKLLDFGVALARDRLAHTQTGNIKGKFGYMSPEQCKGSALDRRSDLFSIGVVLHELVSGSRLFKRANALAAVQAICEEPVPTLGEVALGCPPALERACMRALARVPEERWQTASELRDELLAVVRAEGQADAARARAALMRELFPDRIAEKRRMLDRLVDNHTPTELPFPEADPDVEVPSLELRRRTEPAPRRRSLTSLVVGTALLVSVVTVGTIGYLDGRRRTHRAAATAAPTLRPMAMRADDLMRTPIAELPSPPSITPELRASDPPTASAAMVSVSVVSTPVGARVLVDGKDRGATPLELALPRGSALAHLSLRHAGYVAATRELSLGEDQRVQVVLERAHHGTGAHGSASDGDALPFQRF